MTFAGTDGAGNDSFTIHGRGTSPGLACGPLFRNAPDVRPEQVRGAILVTERAGADDLPRIRASAGTATVGGSLLSHVSLLSREYGKPSVSFGSRSGVTLLPEPHGAVLHVHEAECGIAGAGVDPGDIVFLDGDRGTVRIPGSFDRAARASIRGVFGRLRRLALEPGDRAVLAELARCCSDPARPELAFALEAGLVFRAVPEGKPAHALLETLRSATSGVGLATRLDLVRARILASIAARLDRTIETIAAASDTLAVQRAVAALEREALRARSILTDLRSGTTGIEEALGRAAFEGEARQRVLREQILTELTDARGLGEDETRARAAALHRLVRRGRDAGIPAAEIQPLAERLAALHPAPAGDVPGPLVVSLDAALPLDPAESGGKAAGLAQVLPILPAGSKIPRGFVVTASAYRQHVEGEIGERLREALREPDDAAAARRARAAVLSAQVAPAVAAAVASELAPLDGTPLAVRSSATVEDGPAGSLAGQFDTFLGVRGLAELLNRLRWAWASLWNVGALRSMALARISPLDAGQAVLVQEMVATVAAGVLVSRDAARGADTLLVNANWGLGEGISQGGVPGDLFWVRRSSGECLATELGGGDREVVLDPARAGTIEAVLPPDKAGRPCLDAAQLARLAELVRAFDDAGHAFRDVEFGFAADGALVVFQVRSVGRRPEGQPPCCGSAI